MLRHDQLKLQLGTSLVLGIGMFFLASCGSGDTPGTTTSSSAPSAAAGTTVQVSVSATDPDGDPLHYRWAATEGTINNVDAATTTWVVPPGSGLQFAYVVVSDDKGGYIESRAAALTFTEPQPAVAPPAANISPSSPVGSPGFAWGSVFYKPTQFGRNVYLAGVTVRLSNGRSAITDKKGQFFISNLQNNLTGYSATYEIPGLPGALPFTNPIIVDSANLPTSPSATGNKGHYFIGEVLLPNTLNVAGSVRLADQSYCGIRNEFFTNSSDPRMFTQPISGEAQLFSTANNLLSSSTPSPINHYGDFLIVRSSITAGTQAKVRIRCENGAVKDSVAVNLPTSGPVKIPGVISLTNRRPTIEAMAILFEGRNVERPDLPKPKTLFPSPNDPAAPYFGNNPDLIAEIIHTPGDDTFFTYKGIDTRKSACAYYRAIEAVEGCDGNGFPTGAQLTLDQWRSRFHLFPFSSSDPSLFAPDGQEVRIQYINRSDLNLARDMQAVKLANGDLAYNTCNYPGPQGATDPRGAPTEIGAQSEPDIQRDIDLAIENARRGIGLIACVAMDYTKSSQITRFYTFGPTGKLLLSLSLDGRREKFMPGTCTTCHGGDAYGGQFPIDGSGRPDLKSRWQPFDMANLKVTFSSSQDLADANAAIKTLNQRMVGSGYEPMTTARTRELISGWYAGGRLDQNLNFIPSLGYLSSPPTQADKDLYRNVIQPGCQTCHAAQKQNETLDSLKVCGGGPVLEQNHKMTNSLVPFERFWLDPALPPLLSCVGGRPNYHPAL